MGTVKVVPRSLTDAYKRREGDFAPNLVGLQFTDGVSLFTFGNFQITTNLDRKLNKNFALGGQWSEYYNLENLNLSQDQSEILISNDIFARLNFDINNISRYVYFGSFYEFTRVTIEQIISKWKGSIYLNPTLTTNVPVNTVLSFSYNIGNDTATFLVPKNVIGNPFELIVDVNQDFTNLTPSDIFNLSRDYKKYVIWSNNQNFDVIGYTGSTPSYPYMTVTTNGNPFPSLTATTFGQLTYHIKPNDTEVELFFTQLEDFEKILLNRLTTPIYTSSFNVPEEADGFLVFNNKKLTWPVSDGYNLDINTNDYATYVEDILEMSSLFDSYKTDLVARRFVSESIHEFDTSGDGGDETLGRKVNKLLRIYGREFDEVKKYIDGISFANVVTYDKLDNTSDELIKIMAKTLGFDTLLTVTTDNFNLLQQNEVSYETVFSGYSRTLSSKELDVELWRRLIINAWWLWKSKGTRKVIEFFFNFFKIPGCMVSLDEYIYLAKDKLDIDEVYASLQNIFETTGVGSEEPNLLDYPIDVYGFPRVLPETNDNYFQMNGFWYNGGNESTVGNNPHFGEYDYGKKYFDQFECFVPNFDTLITGSTTVTVNKNYFNNYNEGTFIFDQNGLPVPYYGTTYAATLNSGLVQNAVVNNAGLTYVGGSNAPLYGTPSGDTYSMKLSFTTGTKQICEPCVYEFVFSDDGIVYVKGNPNTPLTDQNCCQNYWLPTESTNPKVVCPAFNQLMITSDTSPYGPCTIISKDKPIPQSCCNKQTLGFDVAWDGKNCVDTRCSKSNGGVIIDNSNTPLNTAKQSTFTSAEIFAGPREDVGTPTFTCYWCPPDSSIHIVCNVDEYLELLTPTEINQLATSLGWTNNGVTSTSFLNTVLTPFFTTNGCLYLDNLSKPIKNASCCSLRGGNWSLINGKYYCVKPTDNPCANNVVNANHVLVNNSTAPATLTTQECCSTLGYTWTDGLITMVGESSFNDSVGLSFINSFGGKFYCTACPTSLITVNDCDAFGVCSLIIKDSVTNTNLSQTCCTDYGFSYDAATGKCLKCPTVVNYEFSYPYTITQLNGSNLSQSCCETTIVGSSPSFTTAWYGIADINGSNSGVAKCYQCPAIYYYTNNSQVDPTPNTNYTIFEGEVLYNGQSLSETCCNNYNNVISDFVVFNVATQKCLLPAQQPTVQEFTLKFGDTSCGINGNPVSQQTRAAWIINAPFSTNYASPGVYITVYVPFGQTPLTSPMFINPTMTTYISPSNTLYSPNGRWERTFEYNNNVYNLNFGNVAWSFPTPINPFPTPVLKGQIGLNCSGF